MNDFTDPRTAIAQIIRQAQRAVMPRTLELVLAERMNRAPDSRIFIVRTAIAALHGVLDDAEDDQGLRFFVEERAAVSEATLILIAFDRARRALVEEMATDSDEFRRVSGLLLGKPSGVEICRLGLRLLDADAPPDSDVDAPE